MITSPELDIWCRSRYAAYVLRALYLLLRTSQLIPRTLCLASRYCTRKKLLQITLRSSCQVQEFGPCLARSSVGNRCFIVDD